jgi:ParB-like chromosome segregation protein Spo0J
MQGSAILRIVDPKRLLDHPFSVAIYGQDLDEAFVDSIRRRGIEQPIIVAADGRTVVAGHRRRNAAQRVGLKRVPIVVRSDLKDDLDIKHAIIEANRQRVKTPEQIGREAQALWKIEQENAAQRRNAQLKQGQEPVRLKSDEREDVANGHEEAGRSDEIVAKELGVGRDTLRKAVYVAQAIDRAAAASKQDAVEAIRKYKTVNAAYREALKFAGMSRSVDAEASPDAGIQPDWLAEIAERSGDFRLVYSLMGEVSHELEAIANSRANADKFYKNCSIAWDRLCHAIIAWEESEQTAN